MIDDWFFENDGWSGLYLYKFKIYLSSVSRYLMNLKIKDVPYYGE